LAGVNCDFNDDLCEMSALSGSDIPIASLLFCTLPSPNFRVLEVRSSLSLDRASPSATLHYMWSSVRLRGKRGKKIMPRMYINFTRFFSTSVSLLGFHV
jgi:hypothetical protein